MQLQTVLRVIPVKSTWEKFIYQKHSIIKCVWRATRPRRRRSCFSSCKHIFKAAFWNLVSSDTRHTNNPTEPQNQLITALLTENKSRIQLKSDRSKIMCKLLAVHWPTFAIIYAYIFVSCFYLRIGFFLMVSFYHQCSLKTCIYSDC